MKKTMLRNRNSRVPSGRQERGFSLLEMLLVLTILTIVLGVVMDGMVQMQQRNFAETSKVDTVQQTRDFMDQMMRDIHVVGYPPGRMMVNNPTCVGNANVSCGLIYFSPTQVRYEGDLDGTGTVYQVWVQLVAPASGNCPCTLQRGVITKAAALGGAQPTYFTEVNGVLNSGNGAGAGTFGINLGVAGPYAAYGTADVFDSYDVNGTLNPVGTCTTAVACSSIRSLQITANVVPSFMDLKTKSYQVYSITSRARMNNGCSIPGTC
jgi:prepilin-type N-terminal cleavage/methylation domain-containing protein